MPSVMSASDTLALISRCNSWLMGASLFTLRMVLRQDVVGDPCHEANGAVGDSGPHGCGDASPTHAVTTGTSESQKSRWRLAHITPPLMRRVARSRWWWLFQ